MQVRQRNSVAGLQTKAHLNDFVSAVDIASETRIVSGILQDWPDDGVLGEEGARIAGSSGWTWVIDPLDGTRNYLTGAGPWSVSIAVQHGNDTVVGVVHDPALDETFSAVRGSGATLNGGHLQASQAPRLAESLVGVSFNPSPATKVRMAGILSLLLPGIGDVRRIPAALALSYLAAGRFDCCLALDTQPWDIAAAVLIAREAGALLGGVAGLSAHELTVGAGPQLWDEYVAELIPVLGAVTRPEGPPRGQGN